MNEMGENGGKSATRQDDTSDPSGVRLEGAYDGLV